MIKQTEHFNQKIRRYGCYFLSLLCICELQANCIFSDEEIQELYDSLITAEVIDEDCYVSAPDAVIKAGFEKLGACGRRVNQIGMEDKNGRRFWGWVKDNRIDYTILKKKRPAGYHFTLAGTTGIELFDPNPDLSGEVIAKIFYHDFIKKK